MYFYMLFNTKTFYIFTVMEILNVKISVATSRLSLNIQINDSTMIKVK